MSRSSYTDIIDGNVYTLPNDVPTNGFREGVYNNTQLAATGTTSRIRALLYVWQAKTLLEDPTIESGPFFNSSDNNLTKEEKDTMRLDSTSGTSNFITLLSDSGYAPEEPEGEIECSDNPGGKDPWEAIINTFNYDPSGGSDPTAFMRRYFTPTAANSGRSESEKLDIWQDDPGDYGTKKGDIVICSDIFHVITPTRYSQAVALPNLTDDAYENYSKVDHAFGNLFQLVEPGGALIFSVPYDGNPDAVSGNVIEKAPFPDVPTDPNFQKKCHLWDWEFSLSNNAEVLLNDPRNTESQDEEIGDLGFTRSINCPPVLRRFTRGALRELLGAAGFDEIQFHIITDDMNAFGIYWNATISGGNWTANNSATVNEPASKSLIVTASRPVEIT